GCGERRGGRSTRARPPRRSRSGRGHAPGPRTPRPPPRQGPGRARRATRCRGDRRPPLTTRSPVVSAGELVEHVGHEGEQYLEAVRDTTDGAGEVDHESAV